MSKPVKYNSPLKGTLPSKPPGPPQIATINTSRDITRRIWIRRAGDGNPTSLNVKESHIVDDLKTMIVERFPMTLAKTCDPSDLIIKLEPSISSHPLSSSHSPGVYSSPSTPSGTRKYQYLAPMSSSSSSIMGMATSPNFNSPLSPIPISASKSPLIQSKPPTHDFGNLSIRSVSPAILPLEADRSLWGIMDQYYPQGMGIDNALIIEVPNQIYPNSSTAAHKKNLSQETITEDKEHEYTYGHSRRMNSLPGHSITRESRSTTPSNSVGVPGHKRSQSNPPEHSSAVLLMPSGPSKTDGKKTGGAQSIVLNSDGNPERVMSPHGTEQEISDDREGDRGRYGGAERERQQTASPQSRLNGSSTMAKVLPSVSVLIVEDNLINLRILSAHLRRHRIHYDVAKNGQEAIDKWRKGGFHLVLMDIQLPVMSGLEASKTIRRLEKLNHIGVFSQIDLQNLPPRKPEEELDLNIFRSPVIIVALTASNLKQDKQQALAAGCNDYLTKPVNLDWLLNKITEWGCMQALIDFDGWKSGERMTNIAAALPSLTRKGSSRRSIPGKTSYD